MSEFVTAQLAQGLATLTLDRPKALNALSLDMLRAIARHLSAWRDDANVRAVVLTSSSTKGLCAGGDIRFFYEAQLEGQHAELDAFFTEEYALNHFIATYPKPYIALMQGVVMGGGMGIAETAGLRIVSENTKIAMPEVNIGLFPDVGGTHFLAQLKGQIGQYLGQSGAVLNAASSLYADLADCYCPLAELPNLQAAIAQACVNGADIIAAAKRFCVAFETEIVPTQSALAENIETINACFSADAAQSLAKLEALASQGNAFAAQTAKLIKTRSPLMIAVTAKAIAEAKNLSLAQALRVERTLIKRNFELREPLEGIRALVIEKDNAPRWVHAHLTEVTAAQVNAIFSSPWAASAHPLRHLGE